MTNPTQDAERAREVLAEHAERNGYPLSAASVRKGDDPYFNCVMVEAMLAFAALRDRPTKGGVVERGLVEALGSAVVFSAYRASDPLAIRFEFANEDDRLAAANEVDKTFLLGSEGIRSIGTECGRCGMRAPKALSADCDRPECEYREAGEAAPVVETITNGQQYEDDYTPGADKAREIVSWIESGPTRARVYGLIRDHLNALSTAPHPERTTDEGGRA